VLPAGYRQSDRRPPAS